MISADFYPTQITQYTVEYTNFIPNLTYDDPETIAASYYMGYINWNDLPSASHMSKFNVVTGVEEAYVEFVDVTKAENVPWFFTGYYTTSSSNTYGTYILNDSDKYVLPSVGAGGNYGFFNNLEIQRVGTYGSYLLYVFYNIINPVTTPPTYSMGGAYLQNTSSNISVEDFWKWVSGEITLHVSITIGSVQENIEFTFDDFAEGRCEKEHTNGTVQFFLVDYSTPYSARDVQPNSSYAGWSNIGVGSVFHAEIDGDEKPYINNRITWHSGYSDERYIRLDNVQTLSHYAGGYTNHVMGGFNGRIPYTYFAYGTTDRYFVFGNMVVWKYTSTQTRIARLFTSQEVAKSYGSLFTRISTNGVNPAYGYANTIAYPLFNDDNSPKWEYVTGLQEDIQDELQEWQYTNITANTFTEDDIPEYTPPSPEPDEDEESGTRIPNQFRYFTGANNFISQYAMKASQIQTFGQMLWNSWADSQTFVDAVNNFWIALNIEDFTGSFDISSVMDFIVSLKVFPFNITHFETSIFTLTNTLRIGRGTFPFLFPSEVGNIIKVLSNIVYVDCGLIHDPTTGQYGIPRKFNDFRDYTNVSITCFCPYCGTVELNAGDVVGRQLSCKYAVDLQSGECLCLITVADSTGDLYNVAAISGNMGAEIPVSATNSGLIHSRRLSDAGNALGLFGGMFTENMSMGSNTFARAKDSQSSIGAIASATSQAAGNLFKDIKQTSNFAANMLSRGAIGCPIMQGGSGFAAFSQADTPYVQIRYGIYSEPANYSHSVGRISTKSDILSNYKDSGLVICENVDVSGFTCHEDERSEIKALLESGVYL